MTTLSRILFAVLFIAVMAMYAFFNFNRHSNSILENEPNPIQYLALGDSYTIGESVSELERWPTQLQRALIANRKLRIDTVLIIAETGWTTDELNVGIDTAKIEGNTYDWVSLSIGVNNQYRGNDTTEYRVELRALIERALAFANNDTNRFFLVNIPDWGFTPFAAEKERDEKIVGQEIETFNQIMRDEAAKAKLAYVDINVISKLAKMDPSLTAEDGLHPSGAMYAQWVIEILNSVDFTR